MTNVIRTRFQGKDGYLNISKGILTLYGGSKPVKWDITKRETTHLLREFLNTALKRGQGVKFKLFHEINKNSFNWDSNGLSRVDYTKDIFSWLYPDTDHTKAILSAMVRANVGN